MLCAILWVCLDILIVLHFPFCYSSYLFLYLKDKYGRDKAPFFFVSFSFLNFIFQEADHLPLVKPSPIKSYCMINKSRYYLKSVNFFSNFETNVHIAPSTDFFILCKSDPKRIRTRIMRCKSKMLRLYATPAQRSVEIEKISTIPFCYHYKLQVEIVRKYKMVLVIDNQYVLYCYLKQLLQCRTKLIVNSTGRLQSQPSSLFFLWVASSTGYTFSL